MEPIAFDIGPSLQMRSVETSSSEALFRLVDANRPHLRKYLPELVREVGSSEGARAHVERCIREHVRNERFEFHIWHEGELCGAVRLTNFEPLNRAISLAYFVASHLQGWGIGTRAARAAMGFAFGDLNMNRIELRCATSNLGSVRIAERLGFTLEGRLRQAELIEGLYVDHFVYGLLREELMAKVAP